MKLKQLIFAAIFIVSCVSIGFAQTDREKGIELFNRGDYQGAIKKLIKAQKKSSQDFEILYLLGVASIKTLNLKEAEKYLEQSIELKTNFPKSLSALAYTLVLRGYSKDALPIITKSVELDSQNAESVYFLGLVNLNLGENETALKNADLAIKLDPKIANAYLLKMNAMLASPFFKPNISNQERVKKYTDLSEIIEKFLSLSPDLSNSELWKTQLESAKFFASYYKDSITDYLGFKIINQPQAVYTENAATANISGVIHLLVEFAGNGKTEHILVIKSLGYGLDENAIQAAKKIIFAPASKDGKPVSTVKILEYSFRNY
jgi:TonB family protein